MDSAILILCISLYKIELDRHLPRESSRYSLHQSLLVHACGSIWCRLLGEENDLGEAGVGTDHVAARLTSSLYSSLIQLEFG